MDMNRGLDNGQERGRDLARRIYLLLCEYEKSRNWEGSLDNILIELMGYKEERRTVNYYKLIAKLSSLRFLSYKYFRSTVFDCRSLIQEDVEEGISKDISKDTLKDAQEDAEEGQSI